MKIKFQCLIIICHFLCYMILVSAEFIKMKKPYLPLNELNLKHFISANLSSNKNVVIDRNRHIEYIQKYFPGFKNRKTNIKFHEIDDPVTPNTFNNQGNHTVTSNSQSVISINGITIAVNEKLQQINDVTFSRQKNVTISPPTLINECSDNEPNGTWSQWILDKACTADCGSCGRLTRTRQCLSFNPKTGSGCPCRGEYKQMEPCNIGVCQFPKPSCCPPYNLIFIEGHFACGPQNETIIQKYLKRVSNG